MELDPVVQYAIDRGIKIGIEAFEKWKDTFLNDPRVIIAKSDAEKLAGGRMVLKNLENRGFISPYQFGFETVSDEYGNVITEPKGRIYYKKWEILKAIENGNILKCLKKKGR